MGMFGKELRVNKSNQCLAYQYLGTARKSLKESPKNKKGYQLIITLFNTKFSCKL